MSKVGRREFVGGALAGSLALLAARGGQGPGAKVEILLDEKLGTISPDIYGHFVEHLGGVVYDGIWVGEDSKVPNVGGVRRAMIEYLKRVKPSVIRYPGGCFADSYDWRDGVGPRARRPRRPNFWGGAEPNSFGTNEFMSFCRATGAKPYMAANLRGLPAQTFYEWVDYCNAPAGATTLADLRATGEAASRDPFGVRFWGVGNESWGCGGNFTPDEYAMEFRRFTASVPGWGLQPLFIAAGPGSDDLAWTRGFFSKMAERRHFDFYGWGLHHYSWNVSRGATTDWDKGKGDALRFDLEEWYEMFREADKMEGLIKSNWAVMGEYDREHRVKLVVDEWGAWYRPGTELGKRYILSQAQTLRDALVAGITLDTFNRHPDKVAMANVAQLVNCLHSLFLATEEKFVATPNFHVFEMYAPHQGAQGLRTVFVAPQFTHPRAGQTASFWALNGSASLEGRTVTLTVVNPHASEARETEVTVRGASSIRSARARVLTATDIHAQNTFENPRGVEPRDETIAAPRGATVVFRFPAASVTRLQFEV